MVLRFRRVFSGSQYAQETEKTYKPEGATHTEGKMAERLRRCTQVSRLSSPWFIAVS